MMCRAMILPLAAVAGLLAAGLLLGSSAWVMPVSAEAWWSDPIVRLRLARMLGALTVGAALAVSGTVFQAVLRNPLAEPFTLGISGGAGVGAALAILLHVRIHTFYAVPGGALAGALAVLVLVLACSRRAGWTHESVLLSGVIAGTVASSVLVYLLSIADRDELAGITWWLLGDLQAVDTTLLYPALAVTSGALAVLVYFGRELNALALGDETAWNLGVKPRFFSILFIVLASLLAAETVALAGLIAFVGLIVPHIVRRIYGCDHRRIVGLAAIWGSAFLMFCDILSRIVHPMRELPIGVLTAAIGGPVFLYLLNRRKAE